MQKNDQLPPDVGEKYVLDGYTAGPIGLIGGGYVDLRFITMAEADHLFATGAIDPYLKKKEPVETPETEQTEEEEPETESETDSDDAGSDKGPKTPRKRSTKK